MYLSDFLLCLVCACVFQVSVINSDLMWSACVI